VIHTGFLLTVRLSGDIAFRGFLVQARVPTNMPDINTAAMLLGAFATGGRNQQLLDCDAALGTMDEVVLYLAYSIFRYVYCPRLLFPIKTRVVNQALTVCPSPGRLLPWPVM